MRWCRPSPPRSSYPGAPTNDPTNPLITSDALRDGSLLARVRANAPPGSQFRSDAEIAASLEATLAHHPVGEDVWLFGYGSLMWNPAMHHAGSCVGTVRGWHRAYCLWAPIGRGTPDCPGLMLALDRGGSSAGMLFRFPAASAREEISLPWRREMFSGAYLARWVRVDTDAGPIRAATFVANRTHPGYAGRLPEAIIAERLAVATGRLGSCVEYLAHTLAVLRAHGKTDHRLERLDRVVGRIAEHKDGFTKPLPKD